MAHLLDIRDLSVTIPTDGGPARILEDVALSLDRGGTLGLVGESGSGKSMTALAIMGLLPRAAHATGAVRLDGDDMLGWDEDRLCDMRGARIAMIFQEPMTALNPVHTIGAQIAEGIRIHLGLGRGEAEDRARRLLDRVGLPAPRFSPHAYPHQLSGGQRQRVMIAIALACEPDLLIADEPTTALDVTVQAQILALIAEIADDTGMALMMITHDLGVVAETTDRVAVMYAGRIVEEGSTAAVFAAPRHPYTAGLFAASPHALEVVAGKRTRLAAIDGQVPDPSEKPAGCAFAPRCSRRSPQCADRPVMDAFSPDQSTACFHPLGLGGVR
ncbi:MAG: ABC transporter ATP-binding protein [Hyphomicrobiales bacterium]|nr:MAG: ABC transporter ATP-binding protein [Hyphomicrobiales bacterium]